VLIAARAAAANVIAALRELVLNMMLLSPFAFLLVR
jgi:hypothetical protein